MAGNSKPNLLYVVHRVPFPPNRGDRIRSYNALKFLASRTNVWLACLADEPLDSGCLEELNMLCRNVCIEHLNPTRYIRGICSLAMGNSATEGMFYSSRLNSTIADWCQRVQFDGVVGFCSSVAPYLKQSHLNGIPKIVDLVDVDSQKFSEYAMNAKGLKKFLYRLESKRLRSLEITIGSECEGVTLVTEPEADIYRAMAPDAHVRAATNGIDLEYFDVHASTQSVKQNATCLFVGALDYLPNVNGIDWFCSNVWPSVKAKCPESKLLIVGRNPVEKVKKLADLPGVEVFGSVPDVRPYYQQASVAIAPLQIARGLQNKVLEAMAMKTAILSTPHAVEGIEINGSQVTVASGEDKWIESLLGLFNDQKKRDEIADAGYKFVRDHHCWEKCLQPVADLLGI